MYHLRAALPLALTLILAACGGQSNNTPPTEPTEPVPVTPAPIPVNPAPTPITPEPPEQPISDVPYYGEWRLVFTTITGSVSFTHSLNITDRAPEPLVNGGIGLQDFCIEETSDPCDPNDTFPAGFGFIGNLPLEDGTAPLSVAIFTQYRQSEDPDLKIFSLEDITIAQDDQGRDSFFVLAAWASDGEIISRGTINATLVGSPRNFDPISPYKSGEPIKELQALRQH